MINGDGGSFILRIAPHDAIRSWRPGLVPRDKLEATRKARAREVAPDRGRLRPAPYIGNLLEV